MHEPPSGNAHRPLRIALLAAPMLPVPPVAYGGTERIVAAIARELARRGHAVSVFASGDSTVEVEVVPVVDRALWPAGYRGDISAHMLRTVAICWNQATRFDLVHSHLETFGFNFARHAPVPVVTTLHGRLDGNGMPELLDEFSDIPLVAISESQRRWSPDANWVGTVHHGLPFSDPSPSAAPKDYLLFVGRIAPEKGVLEAIELARRVSMRLKIVAKVHDIAEKEMFDRLIAPLIDHDGVEFLGELGPELRDLQYAGAAATIMMGKWPEPFGLVAIESLGAGTPVITLRAGALPEIVQHGSDGYIVDDLDEAALAIRLLDRLDRPEIRLRARNRFSVGRMVDAYEKIYRELVAASPRRLDVAYPAGANGNGLERDGDLTPVAVVDGG